jgi:hypothetical protein
MSGSAGLNTKCVTYGVVPLFSMSSAMAAPAPASLINAP